MKECLNKIKEFISNEKAATAIEYGLIAALISIVIVLAVTFIGGQLNQTFSRIGSGLSVANS